MSYALAASPEAPFARAPIRIERVGMDRFETVQALNLAVFGESRVIYRLDRRDLMILLAYADDEPVAFKVGYAESAVVFYSAKGGVLERFRRHGLARALLHRMEAEARAMGYRRFAYDTFPNKHAGMTVLGLAEGFRVTAADFNPAFRDYRLRFEKEIGGG